MAEEASYAEYATLSEKLRALNLKEDSREGAPTCRWRYGSMVQPPASAAAGLRLVHFGGESGATATLRIGRS